MKDRKLKKILRSSGFELRQLIERRSFVQIIVRHVDNIAADPLYTALVMLCRRLGEERDLGTAILVQCGDFEKLIGPEAP